MNFPERSSVCCRALSLVAILAVACGFSRVSYADDNLGAPAAVAADQSEPRSSELSLNYGSSRLRIGFAKSVFSDDLKFYEKLYDKPSNFPTVGFDYSFIRKYVALGVGMKTAYFVDQGHAGQSVVDNPTADEISLDSNGPTELTLIPLGAFGTIQFTPFLKKYLVVDGYAGFERLYFQEVRVNTGGETAVAGQKATSPITIKGTRNSILFGGSLNILLNGLDEQSVNSMRGTMQLGSIYLSPFIEVIKATGGKKDGATFDRTNMGIGFTFESI